MLGDEINFEKLQIFYLLCEFQSFSLVAKTLKLNQSVISRSIKDLENLMQKKLILNNQKPISLTDDGEKLYKLAQKINLETHHVEENLLLQKSDYKYSQIRVFLSISMVLGCILAPKIKKLLDQCPELFIDIAFTNEITLDIFNKRDILIMKKPYHHLLVENYRIQDCEMVFAASKNYIKKHGYPKFADSLPYHNFLYVKNYDYLAIANEKILTKLSTKYLIDNELCAIKAIQSDCGIGIVPKFVIREFPDLVMFELDEKLRPFEIHVAVSKVRKNSYVDLIIDFLRQELTLYD